MPVTHPFVNPKADGGDATITRPSDWNAAHAGAPDVASQLYDPALDQTIVTAATAEYDTDPLIVDSGRLVSIPSTSLLWLDAPRPSGSARTNFNPKDFGAKGDGRRIADGQMTSTSAVLTSVSAPFTAADVGKLIVVGGAGVAGATLPTTILSYQSPSQVTLNATASSSPTAAQVDWGSDDYQGIQNAINAAAGGQVSFSNGSYLVSKTPVIRADGTEMLGAGMSGAVTIKTAATGVSGIQISGAFSSVQGILFDGLSTGTYGIIMHNAARSTIDRCDIRFFLSHGMVFNINADTPTGNNNLCRIVRCRSNDHIGCGYAVPTYQSDNNGIEFLQSEAQNNNGLAGLLYKGEGMRVWGGTYSGNAPGYGIMISEATDATFSLGSVMLFPWLEANTAGGVRGGGKSVRNLLWRDASVQTMTLAAGSEDAELRIENGGTGFLYSALGGAQFVGNLETLTGGYALKSADGFISVGPNPAASGKVRLPNNDSIYIRNGANSGDILVLGMTSADLVLIANNAKAHFGQDLQLATGTAAISPLVFTAGTNLTTAAAGVLEFDGTAFYATPVASNRSVAAGIHFTTCTADFTGTNVATAQPVFNTTEDVITLPASTTYLFEGIYHIHTTGTTSHTFGILFGGTATLTDIGFAASTTNAATEVLGAEQTLWCTAATIQVLTAGTATATHHTVRLKGIVRINGAGTFIPQYQWGTAPGVAGVTLKDSYFTMTPLGSNTVKAVGNWG
jgi:hypothetical protein